LVARLPPALPVTRFGWSWTTVPIS